MVKIFINVIHMICWVEKDEMLGHEARIPP
jgi:hypothetical protein